MVESILLNMGVRDDGLMDGIERSSTETRQQQQQQQQLSPFSSIDLKEPTLTPATMSSVGSSVGSSPSCASPAGLTLDAMPITSQGASSLLGHTSTSERRQHHHHYNPSIWVPLPSPSRPRLDPRYAARIAPELRSTRPSPRPSPRLPSPRLSESDLMPPPGITRDHRDCSIFRPSPVITPDILDDGSNGSAMDATTAHCFFRASPSVATPTYSCRNESGDAGGFLTPRRRRPNKRTRASDVGISDRFIPSRATSNFNFNLWERGVGGVGSARRSAGDDAAAGGGTGISATDAAAADQDDAGDNVPGGSTTSAQSQQNLLNTLLRSELLGENENPSSAASSSSSLSSSSHPSRSSSFSSSSSSSVPPLRESGTNRLRFQSPRQVYQDNVFEDAVGPTAVVNSFSLTPVRSAASQRLMAAPAKRKRRISKVPFKVLDAPALQDDFYLNLVDWSTQNVLAVGLGSCVYLWSACTSKVTKLCDLAASEDVVTAVSWAQRGTHLSVGTNRGDVQLWDTIKCKKVRTMAGHSARVGTLAWTGPILASGSRDRLIYLRDVRVQTAFTDKLTNHKQEVCGLKWSFDEPAFLASGGNDNHLHVIDSRNPNQPIHRFSEHTAAVKAITWSPHQHGLLASGGGTADRCIRFWNTLSGCGLNKIDTGSQVCNLAWSQNCNEIVSTHGYSLNQIVVWRYPSMGKVVTLTGHTYRVLYLAMSPDGSTVVTGAGDETLRFWQIFPGPRSDGKDSAGGLLFPNTLGSVIR